MLTKKDKMLCDFVVRCGSDNHVSRGFFDTYEQVLREYDSIKLDERTTWKQILWEPLDKPNVQVIIKEDSVNVIKALGMIIVVPV